MLYGKYNAVDNYKQKIIKLHQSISPIYKTYINDITRTKNNKTDININSYAYEKENRNKKNQYFISNSVSKTTKNSPRNNLS